MQTMCAYDERLAPFFCAIPKGGGVAAMARHPLDEVSKISPDLWDGVDVSDKGSGSEEKAPGSEKVDVSSLPKPDELEREWRRQKERSARHIATSLIYIFGGFLGVFFLASLMLLALITPQNLSAADVVKITKESIIPLISTIGDISLKLFAPLLAFVLGYYFGERSETSR